MPDLELESKSYTTVRNATGSRRRKGALLLGIVQGRCQDIETQYRDKNEGTT